MCLGTIARVVEAWEERGIAMARVETEAGHQTVCLLYVPEAAVGASVLVHQGYAVEVLDPEEAVATIELLAARHDAEGDHDDR